MYAFDNYRFCSRLSLQVMKEQRAALCAKSKEHDVMIYTGLHETKPEIRNLYFQYSLIHWLDMHWEMMHQILERQCGYSGAQKRELTLFFAGYFARLLEQAHVGGTASTPVVSELLAVQKRILRDLIAIGEKWEENSRRLILETKKHEEQYRKLISDWEAAAEKEAEQTLSTGQ